MYPMLGFNSENTHGILEVVLFIPDVPEKLGRFCYVEPFSNEHLLGAETFIRESNSFEELLLNLQKSLGRDFTQEEFDSIYKYTPNNFFNVLSELDEKLVELEGKEDYDGIDKLIMDTYKAMPLYGLEEAL